MVLGYGQYPQDLQEQQFLEEHPQQQQKQNLPDISPSSGQAIPRRKFAKPPVKVACLACRASRTRCDGQEPCSSCATKGRACSYLPSKRGGPRKKKSTIPLADPDEIVQDDSWNPSTLVPSASYEEGDDVFIQIDPLSLPGAELRHVGFAPEVQGMFAGVFAPHDDENSSTVQQQVPPTSEASDVKQPVVRAYGSEQEILNAYYEFIHQYFPILPPRVSEPVPDYPLEDAGSHPTSPSDDASLIYQPISPLSCAISAILALVPLPNIPHPAGAKLRRLFAQTYANLATTRIEADGELVDSATDPSKALNYMQPKIFRQPFHPRAPVELESILALQILSIYEYAQRGNMMKMRYRAGQAWVLAMNLSLHTLGPEQDQFTEARRRTWWMSYFCYLQGSIVSVTSSPVMINDPRFTTPYPQFASDSEGWSIFLQAQQLLIASNQFTVDFNRCLKSQSNMQWAYEQMKQLDAWAMSLATQANTSLGVARVGDWEHHTAESIRGISRIKISSAQIKIHQFRAFSDLPVSIKKHFDFTTTTSSLNEPINERDIVSLACQCHQFQTLGNMALGDLSGGPPTDATAATTVASGPIIHANYCWLGAGFPFTTQQSSDICLKAALTISQMLGSLPYPLAHRNSSRRDSGSQQHQQSFADTALLDPNTQLPRTMPHFTSCAMQGSYALLMLIYKARASSRRTESMMYSEGNQPSEERYIDELCNGLEHIIGAVSNYSRAFEALTGMRDNIENAIHTALSQP